MLLISMMAGLIPVIFQTDKRWQEEEEYFLRLAGNQHGNIKRALAYLHGLLWLAGGTGEQEGAGERAAHAVQAGAVGWGVAGHGQVAVRAGLHQQIPGDGVICEADVHISAIGRVFERVVAGTIVAVKNEKERNARVFENDGKFAMAMAQLRGGCAGMQRITGVLAAGKRKAGRADIAGCNGSCDACGTAVCLFHRTDYGRIPCRRAARDKQEQEQAEEYASSVDFIVDHGFSPHAVARRRIRG